MPAPTSFGDEDTQVAQAGMEHHAPDPDAKLPSVELIWVEEPGMGMVLRVRQIEQS